MAKSIIDVSKALYLAEVLKVCGNGKSEAIKGCELEELIGIQQIRAYINYLRCEGYPIGSCAKGYYYITSNGEYMETYRGIKGRIFAMEDALNGIKEGWQRVAD